MVGAKKKFDIYGIEKCSGWKNMREFTIQSSVERPILFRTMNKDVYEATLRDGSIWMRSAEYYQEVEDKDRRDASEGVNSAKTSFELNFGKLKICGDGNIGQSIVPHYIMSMHGTSISDVIRDGFGGCTVGVKNASTLVSQIMYAASKQVEVTGFRWGPVSYRYTSLMKSYDGAGAAISIEGVGGFYLKSVDTDVLRKDPIYPFIEQDEWRIVIFVKEYYNGDRAEPLKISVDPGHFYEYIPPA